MVKQVLITETIANILMGEIQTKYPDGARITKEVGGRAIDYCSDYPLYASSSNITYQEAIAIALILGFDPSKD